MNREEWLKACRQHVPGIFYWRTKCESIRKSLLYNKNPEAIHKHHLFNTPEQIAYNNEHYEMWGFNLDGTFEYGKYIIFVTPEEHSQIHKDSDITRQKKSDAQKLRHKLHPFTDEQREHFSKINLGEKNPMYGKHPSEETLEKRSKSISASWTEEKRRLKSIQCTGDGNYFYGKHHSDESKIKIGYASKKMWENQTVRKKIIDSKTGVKQSEDVKQRKRLAMAIIVNEYKEYKLRGGSMSWNEFQKNYFHNRIVEDD